MLPEAVNISAFVMKRLTFKGSTLRSRDPEYQINLRDLFEKDVLPGFLDGRFSNPIERTFKWEDIKNAHELMESNETKGKIVCVID